MVNILFITADQWRGDCLLALGHPDVKTPSLDRLACDGVLFSRHYAQVAPCGPSRASLYTGTYLHDHGVYANGIALDGRHTNMALEARQAGYRPTLFGYTDTIEDPNAPSPENQAHPEAENVLSTIIWNSDPNERQCLAFPKDGGMVSDLSDLGPASRHTQWRNSPAYVFWGAALSEAGYHQHQPTQHAVLPFENDEHRFSIAVFWLLPELDLSQFSTRVAFNDDLGIARDTA